MGEWKKSAFFPKNIIRHITDHSHGMPHGRQASGQGDALQGGAEIKSIVKGNGRDFHGILFPSSDGMVQRSQRVVEKAPEIRYNGKAPEDD